MTKISCLECKQCNRKGKPSVMRDSKYCDTHYKYRVKPKRNILKWFTNIKDRLFEKRAEYDDKGILKDINTKGFRGSWFYK